MLCLQIYFLNSRPDEQVEMEDTSKTRFNLFVTQCDVYFYLPEEILVSEEFTHMAGAK